MLRGIRANLRASTGLRKRRELRKPEDLLRRDDCAVEADWYRVLVPHQAANAFLCRYGEEYDFVKVLDFGIVTAASESGDSEMALSRSRRGSCRVGLRRSRRPILGPRIAPPNGG